MPNTRLTTGFAALGLAASSLIIGCGKADTAKSTTPAAANVSASPVDASGAAIPPNILTDADIQKQPAGSPGRALLVWAQSIQFSDPAGVAGLSTTQAIQRMGGLSQLNKAVGLMGAAFARITIAGVEEPNATTARVRCWMSSFDPKGKRVSFTPTTFALTKVGTTWKLSDLTLVAKTLRDYEALARKSKG